MVERCGIPPLVIAPAVQRVTVPRLLPDQFGGLPVCYGLPLKEKGLHLCNPSRH